VGRALLVLWNDAKRAQAIDWIKRAPKETRVTFEGPKRTLPQNSLLWSQLTEISEQVVWHGQKLSPEDWKVMAMSGLHQEMRVVPNIAGNGFVPLGRSSSKLSVEEMKELIEFLYAFGTQHGVVFGDYARKALAAYTAAQGSDETQ